MFCCAKPTLRLSSITLHMNMPLISPVSIRLGGGTHWGVIWFQVPWVSAVVSKFSFGDCHLVSSVHRGLSLDEGFMAFSHNSFLCAVAFLMRHFQGKVTSKGKSLQNPCRGCSSVQKSPNALGIICSMDVFPSATQMQWW